ncbi:MAG: hypothetical protein Q8S06_00610 [Methanobacteriaceae archaeon]|nr:hypothetical protein [Methanobacteriaceae archaeon]MDP3623352.1 hypothetical protein [Methanobacteriaceae archaeon]
MDLDLTWEQKALIGVGAVVLIILIYAYGPFNFTSDVNMQNNISSTPVSNQQLLPVNSPSGNNSSNNANVTVNITAQKAKEIAALPGYVTGTPTPGSIVINNQTVSVWIVPLSLNSKIVKEVYVDKTNGNIVATRDITNSTVKG